MYLLVSRGHLVQTNNNNEMNVSVVYSIGRFRNLKQTRMVQKMQPIEIIQETGLVTFIGIHICKLCNATECPPFVIYADGRRVLFQPLKPIPPETHTYDYIANTCSHYYIFSVS